MLDGHPWDEARVRRALPALLESDRVGVIWLIDCPAVGYLVITWGYSIEAGGTEALLDEVYLRSRGQGLGRAALREALDDLRARGMPRIFLETERHNAAAREFYASLGFEEENSIWMQRSLQASAEC